MGSHVTPVLSSSASTPGRPDVPVKGKSGGLWALIGCRRTIFD